MINRIGLLVLLCSTSLLSCISDDSDDGTSVIAPVNYDFVRDGASTVSFTGQTIRIAMASELIAAMGDFNVSKSTLLEMYSNQTEYGSDANPYSDPLLNQSAKSIKSKVASSADFFSSNTTESAIIQTEIASWIEAHIEEVVPNSTKLAAIGVAGQIADGSTARYVNAKGLEYNQAINKSLIGALMIDQICNNYLSTSVLDAGNNVANNDTETTEDGKTYTSMEHKWDEAYGYLFGASEDVTDPLKTLGDDSFLSKYVATVDNDSDFAGIASTIFEAFKLGRAAIVEKNYSVRDIQADIIREELAKVIAVRSIYYLQSGKKALAAQNYGSAFHDLSEGFGFVYSLRFIRNTKNDLAYFDKTEIDGFINSLMFGNGFWDVSGSTLDQISESIASKFDFTITEAAE